MEIVSHFNREFFESPEIVTYLGGGSYGGKASGLIFIKKFLDEKVDSAQFPQIRVSIPRMVVLRTEIFDSFIERNNLYEIAYSNESDERIANAFLKADLPVEILGDLVALIEKVHTPLAIRSSSLLEDAKYEPFAGIYATKMIPNNQPDNNTRFLKLVEAIKFVFASTFFKASKEYFAASSHSLGDEKMAVVIQEVFGKNYNNRFYPEISGVARSYNFYPTGKAKPEQGIVSLALGLGKTIVDGGVVWSYSPAFPKSVPPFADPTDIMKNTQLKFWAVNMNPLTIYDPVKETEFLVQADLKDADYDNTLIYSASTYDAGSNRLILGVSIDGPRVLTFAPLLTMNLFGFNEFIKRILKICEESLNSPVEIEFAMKIDRSNDKLNFGFLQVRPMVVSAEEVEIDESEMKGENVLVASDRVLGNGIYQDIDRIIYVKPEKFDKLNTQKIASEIEEMNRIALTENKKFVLIGFGRWGSSDPWLGIPVDWGQIAGAKVIVESTLFDINVELSQGSHFFHNLTSFNVSYFSINFDGRFKLDWRWLNEQEPLADKEFTKLVRLANPLKIKVDGRSGKGVIHKW